MSDEECQGAWSLVKESFERYDLISDGEAEILRSEFKNNSPEVVLARNVYLENVRKFANLVYGIDAGDIVLCGLNEIPFEISHFTINCANSNYGEIEANGAELEKPKSGSCTTFFRIDLVPYKRLAK